jgi:hypothetical protein
MLVHESYETPRKTIGNATFQRQVEDRPSFDAMGKTILVREFAPFVMKASVIDASSSNFSNTNKQ